MIPHEAVWAVLALFPVSEIALAVLKRARPNEAAIRDRGTLRMLWLVISASVASAAIASRVEVGSCHLDPDLTNAIAVLFTLLGLTLRWVSIAILGRYFTVNVAIHAGQKVIRCGPYRFIRHPSYTGLLLAFLGLSFFFANWISFSLLMVPVTLVTLRRIKLEESALIEGLGDAYLAYCAETKRLVPWIY